MSSRSPKTPNEGQQIFLAAQEGMLFSDSGNKHIFDAFEKKPALYKRRLKRLVRTKSFDRCFWCDINRTTQSKKLHKWRIDLIVSCSNKGDPKCIDNQIPVCVSCYTKRYQTEGLSSDSSWREFCEKTFVYANKTFVENFSKISKPIANDSWLEYFTAYRLKIRRSNTFKKRIQSYKHKLKENPVVPSRIRKEYTTDNCFHPSKTPTYSTRNSLRKYLIQNEGSCCVWCSKDLCLEDLTLDHIIPRSAGGSHWINNIIASCEDCNTCRSSLPADVFLRYAANPNADLIFKKMAALQSDPRRYQSFWRNNSESIQKIIERHQCSPYIIDDVSDLVDYSPRL